ncbi:hypothetical protein [Nocardia otitidiscaviarum]|uniref:MarR family transcriptional regulator n=1 Tax=Nocardia otitidiscaviarum TaxID=1823 RepID=A0A516NFS3_9NOCA|nr:hypothetical protein [Nocardia otitidiscaviarum]MBF6178291.1 hypothetical protein [Nocardia otitidiscaviarum]MCP9623076.1 hypothetical protein [Nocardia otitidiscaviarum]QDP77741.1 hypothetical protein FOH10_02250 [Nocardia otitidiscaviarum]
MNITEAKVLATLTPGGHLTAAQIATGAGISSRLADHALEHLTDIGMVGTPAGYRRGIWAITARGRAFAATPRGRGLLDVPAGV